MLLTKEKVSRDGNKLLDMFGETGNVPPPNMHRAAHRFLENCVPQRLDISLGHRLKRKDQSSDGSARWSRLVLKPSVK